MAYWLIGSLKQSQFAIAVAAFGSLAFIFGIIAENKKPAAGIPVIRNGVAICRFPNDPTVPLGSLSVANLLISSVLGFISIFYPYKGVFVPKAVLFRTTALSVFFVIAIGTTLLAEGMMLWATISEGMKRKDIHHNLETDCASAKTGLFGGAGFLALDAALFWLVCQMLTGNAREDFLEDDDPKGTYGQVHTTDYDASVAAPTV